MFKATLYDLIMVADEMIIDNVEVKVSKFRRESITCHLADEETIALDPDQVVEVDKCGACRVHELLDDEASAAGESAREFELRFLMRTPITKADLD